MASCPFPFPTKIDHHLRHAPPPIYNCAAASKTSDGITCCFVFTTVNLHRSFSWQRKSRLGRCHATNPQSEPPSKKHRTPSSDVVAAFTRFQDTLQIFFAVLFWMSLFFWSCAWDGRNNGKPKKDRFRK